MSTNCGKSDYVSGPYEATIEGISDASSAPRNLGTTRDGFEIFTRYHGEEVRGDVLGQGIGDTIQAGGDCFVTMELLQANVDGFKRLLHQHQLEFGKPGDYPRIGCKGSWTGFELVLEIVDGLKGAENTEDKYTFPRATLDPTFPLAYYLNSRLRVLPVRFQIMPYLASDETWRWYYTESDLQPPSNNTNQSASALIVI